MDDPLIQRLDNIHLALDRIAACLEQVTSQGSNDPAQWTLKYWHRTRGVQIAENKSLHTPSVGDCFVVDGRRVMVVASDKDPDKMLCRCTVEDIEDRKDFIQ